MERTDVLELMATLKLYGMRAAYDEVMTTGIKRRHEPPRIVGDLLSAEIAEKQARSIKYQLTVAKLPRAKDIDNFDFTGTPVNEALIRDLASGNFLARQDHRRRHAGGICQRRRCGALRGRGAAGDARAEHWCRGGQPHRIAHRHQSRRRDRRGRRPLRRRHQHRRKILDVIEPEILIRFPAQKEPERWL
jgi:IstB-like ATP binding protein